MKALTFFDTETTSADAKTAKIVEIGIIRIENGEETVYQSYINPGIPIPKEATDVHGITDEMVKNAPKFSEIANNILWLFGQSDIVGYNSNSFDIPLLYNEFNRCGIDWNLEGVLFLDACTIFKRMESRTLTAAMKFYLDENHEDAHGAIADVKATMKVFEKQLNRYQELTNLSFDELALYCNYDKPRADLSGNFVIENGVYMMNFGKHKGTPAKDCKDYLKWMLNQDFMPDTKAIINTILAQK